LRMPRCRRRSYPQAVFSWLRSERQRASRNQRPPKAGFDTLLAALAAAQPANTVQLVEERALASVSKPATLRWRVSTRCSLRSRRLSRQSLSAG
jgi:hypothetical protein